MGQSQWWRGMPRWLKLIYVFIAVPAWLVVMLCVVTGEGRSLAALVAFGVFCAAAMLHILFDRRRRGADQPSNEVEFGSE